MSLDFLDGTTITVTSIFLFAMEALGILSVIHALRKVRTAQATTAWCVGLLVMPVLVVPAYWIFGRPRFFSYRDALRRIRASQPGPAKNFAMKLDRIIVPGDFSDTPLHRVARVANEPVTHGNELRPLIDGQETYEVMLDEIYGAKEYLLVQFFIIQDDFVGNEFAEALIDRARAGVRVFLLYDDIGCQWLPRHYLDSLLKAGVQVSSFSTRRGLRHRLEINFRNHRKIVVIDGRVGLTGGLNIGDEYRDGGKQFRAWRDTHLELRGPSVQALQAAFCQDWFWARREIIDDLLWNDRKYQPTADVPDRETQKNQAQPRNGDTPNGQAVVMPTGPADLKQRCSMMFCQLAAEARERLWISTPYFVPDEAVATALVTAVARGVEVRLLIPSRPDHLLVYLAGQYHANIASSVGIGIYRYRPGFLHQKAVLVDDAVAAIGSANLDNRSLHLNFEVTVASDDPCFVSAVHDMLNNDFQQADRLPESFILERPYWFQVVVGAARLFSPIL